MSIIFYQNYVIHKCGIDGGRERQVDESRGGRKKRKRRWKCDGVWGGKENKVELQEEDQCHLYFFT